MPVRRDFTGYTYELEGLRDSSLSGVFLDLLSSSCMTERMWRSEAKGRKYRQVVFEEEYQVGVTWALV